ncbi:MAG: hypothetical protein C0417_08940 [Chlorobiaceae bacterium]|nr:hypothetical protein [Chlorobiaceae bacterium]
MVDEETIDLEFYKWISRSHLLYLKRLRLLGHKIDNKRIETLEKEMYSELDQPENQGGGLLGQRDVDELQLLFSIAEEQPAVRASIKVNLCQYDHTVLRMHPDHNHKRPHFHIEYKQQYKASYSIDPLERLAGHVPAQYEKPILDWASTRLRELKLTWDKLKSGEDVRELVLIAEEF